MGEKDTIKRETPDPRRKGRVDRESEGSFPASDPPSYNPGTAGGPSRKDEDEDKEKDAPKRGVNSAMLRHGSRGRRTEGRT